MICTRLHGGLGNQLFQYAAGRVLATLNHTTLLLDLSGLSNQPCSETPRKYELKHFTLGPTIFAGHESIPKICKYLAPLSRLYTPWRIHVQRGNEINAHFFKLPDQTYLLGYWQSYLYFQCISSQIFEELSPACTNMIQGTSLLDSIVACKYHSVALHVRRGDYVSSPSANFFHGVLPPSYYESAIHRLSESLEEPHFFIFSDDPHWCQQNLNLEGFNYSFVSQIQSSAWQDLLLMSYCHHHIIANSTFSWWSAWLADQRFGFSRTVIAPSRWCVSPNMIKSDLLFPTHWLVI